MGDGLGLVNTPAHEKSAVENPRLLLSSGR
jgi:hypothetical protein